MTILAKVERIVNGLREIEGTRAYTLERPEFETIGDAERWLRGWCEDDLLPWVFVGEEKRRQIAIYWLYLRWLREVGEVGP